MSHQTDILSSLQKDIAENILTKLENSSISKSEAAVISRTTIDLIELYNDPADLPSLLDSIYEMFPILQQVMLRYKRELSRRIDEEALHGVKNHINSIIHHERRTPTWS